MHRGPAASAAGPQLFGAGSPASLRRRRETAWLTQTSTANAAAGTMPHRLAI